jgi:hypothetical protein
VEHLAGDPARRVAADRRTGDEGAVNDDLTRLLEDEARLGMPPESSDTLARAFELGPAATPTLEAAARGGGAAGLLAVEALRASDPAAYDALPASERAAAYADALRTATIFNAWGHPPLGLSPAAQAFVALGPAAVEALKPLLDDTRPAPMFGSQDATTAHAYGNRVCDYAYALIEQIRGGEVDYPRSPEERDERIAALRAELG